MMATPPVPVPDEKDWTWTLRRVCPECGFDPVAVGPGDIPERVVHIGTRWQQVLERADIRVRPEPMVWSPLEYAAHIRDVLDIFAGRAQLMLDQDEPTYPNWDQDATALQKRYWESDSAVLSGEIGAGAEHAAAVFAAVPDDAWNRRGLRSNGSEFTVRTLGTYFLHDLIHHLHDVDG